ncbi:HpcH/HpaI aldolase/citrate lyase family protein [Rhizorhabdus dicambivorans]|uniref:CoA ester lyase n=1 Tax=Rhizorhabdus dicambivorans TaxID=1850238 RepID=A0A2A4FS77_9SPHN|nr:CoA ester lyase [Rhizorhabdus dicambivorans]ATE67206.1 CoA ester lyase [Rhizorhabdus dicambivorans]PCE40554.1 CoA ester lyase [Rhizorhabdus dicambivorans]
MSAQRDERPLRLQRSELAVPASSEKFFEKAARGPADSLFLDLEDAVAPDQRVAARAAAVKALGEVDWGQKIVSVRVNGLGTIWGLDDILAVARCPRLDMVLIPKVETPDDVIFVDRLLSEMDLATPRERPLGIEILIETTKGLANVEAIAACSKRLEGIIFGVGDYSIELQNFDTVFGSPSPDYAMRTPDGAMHWNDQWHFALARIANACRAYGLRPIDGPYANYGDVEGYRNSCRRSRALGFEGKWAIHPSQAPLANEEFAPRPEHLRWARDIEAKMARAAAEGQGAIGLDGVLIDRAHVKLAERILRRAALAEGR